MSKIEIDDRFHCTAAKMEDFKKTDIWAELRSWIEARRNRLADDLDDADGELAIRLISKERSVLRDLLELPDLVIASLQLRDNNAAADEEEDNINVNGE